MTDLLDSPTKASDSFAVTLSGTFRTAAFGGEALEQNLTNDTAQPTIDPLNLG